MVAPAQGVPEPGRPRLTCRCAVPNRLLPGESCTGCGAYSPKLPTWCDCATNFCTDFEACGFSSKGNRGLCRNSTKNISEAVLAKVDPEPLRTNPMPTLDADGRYATLNGRFTAKELMDLAEALDWLAAAPTPMPEPKPARAERDPCTCPVGSCLRMVGTLPDHLRCTPATLHPAGTVGDVTHIEARRDGRRVAGETYGNRTRCSATKQPCHADCGRLNCQPLAEAETGTDAPSVKQPLCSCGESFSRCRWC